MYANSMVNKNAEFKFDREESSSFNYNEEKAITNQRKLSVDHNITMFDKNKQFGVPQNVSEYQAKKLTQSALNQPNEVPDSRLKINNFFDLNGGNKITTNFMENELLILQQKIAGLEK